jgi:hypothetical protein
MMAKFTSHVTTSGHSLTGPVTTGCRQSRTSREPVGDEHGVPVASGFKIALSMSLQLSVDIRYVGLKNYFTARTKASRATYLRIFRYRTTALHAKLRSTVFSEGRLILTRSLFDPGQIRHWEERGDHRSRFSKTPQATGGCFSNACARAGSREVMHELLTYDERTHLRQCLNWTAAAVWRACDGERTITDIARHL